MQKLEEKKNLKKKKTKKNTSRRSVDSKQDPQVFKDSSVLISSTLVKPAQCSKPSWHGSSYIGMFQSRYTKQNRVYWHEHFFTLYAEYRFCWQCIYQQQNHILHDKTSVPTRYKCWPKLHLCEHAYFFPLEIYLPPPLFAFPAVPPGISIAPEPVPRPGSSLGSSSPLTVPKDHTDWFGHLNSRFPPHARILFFPIRGDLTSCSRQPKQAQLFQQDRWVLGNRGSCLFPHFHKGNEYRELIQFMRGIVFVLPSDCLTSLFSIAKRFPYELTLFFPTDIFSQALAHCYLPGIWMWLCSNPIGEPPILSDVVSADRVGIKLLQSIAHGTIPAQKTPFHPKHLQACMSASWGSKGVAVVGFRFLITGFRPFTQGKP